MSNHLVRLCIILVLSISIASCDQGPQELGIIEGKVTIGPLVPVLREGEIPPTPAPEVYSAREIVVYEKDGVTEFTRLQIDSNGKYRGELPVGTYVIDINRIGIDRGKNLPIEIEITNLSITTLDIEIDTGIR
jgi:hypothetical protein